MEGLPREFGQAKACADLARVQRNEQHVPFSGRARRCFACRSAWFNAEKGVPAVAYELVDGMHTWTCRCCNAHRSMRADGRVESVVAP